MHLATHTAHTGQIVPFAPRSTVVALPDLFQGAAMETFAAGRSIFWEGDPATDVFFIGEGVLRLYRSLADGRRAITGFVSSGEIVGLAFRNRYLYTAEAITDVKLRRLPRARLQEAIDDSRALRPLLLGAISDELSRAQDQILLLGRKTADERVASFILSMAERSGSLRRNLILPMTRLDMADYLGLTIETVCRVLTRMQRDGLIKFRGRYDLVLEKVRELRELAGMDDEIETNDTFATPSTRRAN